ncbi:bomanin-836 [Drosophila ficusphila]|uniref:bomanin-836 n=1 Tax=Drosophila ficusphila TaxID=30025 RepID=UPI0007E62A50|nr:bomanin-836 [Drosophila ficusphila]
MNSIQIAGALMLLCCLLVAVNATPGKVYINGKCIDCNKPENDDDIVMPMAGQSGSMSYSLTSGAIIFGIIYQLIGSLTI